MTKHTPGPWKAEQTLNEWCITGPNVDDDPYSGVVVFCDAGVNGEANARLIAAAPDLLAACEEAECVLGNMGYTTDDDGEAGTIYHQLRAAIAKAKGET